MKAHAKRTVWPPGGLFLAKVAYATTGMHNVADEPGKRTWTQTRNHEGVLRGACAFVALLGVLWVGWWADWEHQFMPVLLGVVASALSETDDSWRGRLRAQTVALLVFAVLAVAVRALAPWPLAQALLLAGSGVLLTLMGSVSERYTAIALGSMVFAIFTALVAHRGTAPTPMATPLMLAGAAWYGLVTVVWSAVWPQPPVRYRLSRLYALLGEYLRLKAQLLEPVRDADLAHRRLALALHNGRVVNALNAAKECLFVRLPPGPRPQWLQVAMQQYLAAQDIHERVSSSHEHYELLAQTFFHSDVLYRCQRVLTVLGDQSQKFAEAIRHHSLPSHQGITARAIEDMQAAIAHIDQHVDGATAVPERARRAMRALGHNLQSLALTLAHLHQPPTRAVNDVLWNRQPRSWKDAFARVRAHCYLESPQLRHAVRLGLGLLMGYGVMAWSHDPHGYWILLTVLFVSQARYADTLQRAGERAGGTAVGLALGWALIRLFPDAVVQSALLAVAGGIFVGARSTRYALATASISVLLLLSFHQTGMAHGVIPSRMFDTLVGAGIAWLAGSLLLPTWQGRQWPRLAAQSLQAQVGYLREIVGQWSSGKQDHLAYRTARRNAHNADAALSNAYAAMLKEPAHARSESAQCGQFLILSHTLLNYLSALGAHRGNTDAGAGDEAMCESAEGLCKALTALAEQLLRQSGTTATTVPAIAGAAAALPDGLPAHTGAAQPLQLALKLLPELQRQTAQMMASSFFARRNVFARAMSG